MLFLFGVPSLLGVEVDVGVKVDVDAGVPFICSTIVALLFLVLLTGPILNLFSPDGPATKLASLQVIGDLTLPVS